MFSRIKRKISEYRGLKYLAYHDSLTGLLNRNWLYKNISTINHKYIYFIDINDLREVNKRGHTCGDEHIKNIISKIPQFKCDYLIRYAGDEFILFSNYENLIKTNDLYTVGESKNNGNLINSIMDADMKMIESKNIFKNEKILENKG